MLKYLVGVVCKWLSDGFSRESLCVCVYPHMYAYRQTYVYRESRRRAMQWCGNSNDLSVKPVQMSTALVFTGFLASWLFKGRRVGAGGRGQCLRPAGVASCGENVRLGPGKIAFSSRAPSSWVRAVFVAFGGSQGASVWDYSWAVNPQRRGFGRGGGLFL